jgi:hypothetical protein
LYAFSPAPFLGLAVESRAATGAVTDNRNRYGSVYPIDPLSDALLHFPTVSRIVYVNVRLCLFYVLNLRHQFLEFFLA